MKRKRHSTDEIIRKLREAEAMEASGTSAAEGSARQVAQNAKELLLGKVSHGGRTEPEA